MVLRFGWNCSVLLNFKIRHKSNCLSTNTVLSNDQIKMSLVFIAWGLTEQVNMQIVRLRLDAFFLAEKVTNGLTCVLIKFLTSVHR